MSRAVLALAVFASAACGGAAVTPSPAPSVSIELREWKVAAPATLPAGKTTLLVRNIGANVHDLTIVQTTLAPDAIPQDGSKAVEDGVVGKSSLLNPGQSQELTLELAPGAYVLICNQPGHYALGMRTAVSVK